MAAAAAAAANGVVVFDAASEKLHGVPQHEITGRVTLKLKILQETRVPSQQAGLLLQQQQQQQQHQEIGHHDVTPGCTQQGNSAAANAAAAAAAQGSGCDSAAANWHSQQQQRQSQQQRLPGTAGVLPSTLAAAAADAEVDRAALREAGGSWGSALLLIVRWIFSAWSHGCLPGVTNKVGGRGTRHWKVGSNVEQQQVRCFVPEEQILGA
jgi:hypothetical protein